MVPVLEASPSAWLEMVEQPGERVRFRYKAEQGPHGGLPARSKAGPKSCPRVRVRLPLLSSVLPDLTSSCAEGDGAGRGGTGAGGGGGGAVHE